MAGALRRPDEYRDACRQGARLLPAAPAAWAKLANRLLLPAGCALVRHNQTWEVVRRNRTESIFISMAAALCRAEAFSSTARPLAAVASPGPWGRSQYCRQSLWPSAAVPGRPGHGSADSRAPGSQ